MRNLDVPVFHTVDGSVYYMKSKLRGADPKTFIPLGGSWAKDAKKVFFASFECRNIDATSFRRLNQCFGADNRAAYTWNKELKDSDPVSFTVLDGGVVAHAGELFGKFERVGYAKDANRAWYADYTSPKEVCDADVGSFISLGNRFGRDHASIFFEQKRIDGADITPGDIGTIG